jgi:chromosome segregation ATPase
MSVDVAGIPEVVQQKINLNLENSSFHDISLPAPHREKRKDGQSLYYFDNRKPPSLLKDIKKGVHNLDKKAYGNDPESRNRHQDELLHEMQNQNKLLKDEIQYLHDKGKEYAKQVESERAALLEQKHLTEQLTDSKLSKEIAVLQSQVHILEADSKQQRQTILQLTEKCQVVEERLIQTTRRLEKSVKTNRILVDRAAELDESLNETQQKWLNVKKEYEAMERWVRSHKSALDDYEGAIRESNLYNTFPEDLANGFPLEADLLTRQVKGLVREKKEVASKCKALEQELLELKSQFNSATQKYLIDSEQKRAQIASTEGRLENAQELIERLEAQLKESQKDNLRLSLKNTKLEEENKLLIRKYEEEITEQTSKSASQLKSLREQFESDRCELRMTIEKLQSQKVDLQVMIVNVGRSWSVVTRQESSSYGILSSGFQTNEICVTTST